MTEASLFILLGLVLLYGGGEALVRGATSLALRAGLTPTVAGLTVVAFGTSTPELFASVKAALADKGNIAVGNAIGANIFNVGVVLGVTALMRPLTGGMQLLKFEVPFMLGVVALPIWVLWDRNVSQLEAAVLLLLFLIYTFLVVRIAKSGAWKEADGMGISGKEAETKGNALRDVLFVVAGIAMLVFGSHWMVDGAEKVARYFEVSEAVIGLTIVAAGTSLPELASCLVAAFRGKPGVALGNVIGSNIFNTLAVLGACGAVRGVSAPGVAMVDIAVMIIFAATLLPMLRSGMSLDRWEGVSLVLAYGVYLWWHWPR